VERRRRLSEILDVVENLLVAAAGPVLDVGQRAYLALHLELNLLVNDLSRRDGGGKEGKQTNKVSKKRQVVRPRNPSIRFAPSFQTFFVM